MYNKIINNSNKYNVIYFKDILTKDHLNYKLLVITYCALALNIQNKNGVLIIIVPFVIDYNIISECIYLLKKL